MHSTSRRGFIGLIAALISGGGGASWWFFRKTRLRQGSTPSVPVEPKILEDPTTFPFLDKFHPFPPREPHFDQVSDEPSFLHPNGHWVAMPSPSGGYELWDWMDGRPVRVFGGNHRGERKRGYCENVAQYPGCFSGDGGAWVWGHSWRGGDDGNQLHGQSLDSGKTWDFGYTPLPAYLDSTKGFLYTFDNTEGNSIPVSIDTKSGQKKQLVHLSETVPISRTMSFAQNPIAISPDGRWLVCHHSQDLNLGWWAVWCLSDMKCRAFRKGGFTSNPGAVRFSLDGSRVYGLFAPEGFWDWAGQTTSCNQVLPLLWDKESFGPDEVQAEKDRFTLVRRKEGIVDVLASPGKQLFRRLVAFPPNHCIVAFSPKSDRILATPPLGEAWLWNRKGPTRKVPGNIQDFLIRPCFSPLGKEVRSLAWSKDDRWIALGLEVGSVRLVSAPDLRLPVGTKADEVSAGPSKEIGNLSSPIRGLAFGGPYLAAVAMNGQAAIWTLDNQNVENSWKAHPVRANALKVGREGTWCITGGLDGLALWSLPGMQLIGRHFSDRQGVASLDISPSEQTVAVAFLDGSIAMVSLPDLKLLWTVQGHADVASAVAFHPSGRWLVSTGWDEAMHGWDVGSGKQIISERKSGASLAWNRDGKRLAVGRHDCVLVLDEQLKTLEGSSAKLDYFWDEDCT